MALGHWAVEYLGEGNGQGGSGGFAPDITNPQDGDTLVYNATAGKWVNGSGGGGGAMLLTVTKTVDYNKKIYALSKTWKEIKDALAEGAQMVLYGEGTGEAAGMYAQFTVGGVGVHDGAYMVFNGTAGGPFTYESAVLGAEDVFSTTTEDGYPMVTIYDGN